MGSLSEVVLQRLDRELGVINKLGFPKLLPDRVGFRAGISRARCVPTTARGSGVRGDRPVMRSTSATSVH